MELRNKVVLVVGVSTVSGQKLDVTLADFGVCAATYRSTLKVLERGLRGRHGVRARLRVLRRHDLLLPRVPLTTRPRS